MPKPPSNSLARATVSTADERFFSNRRGRKSAVRSDVAGFPLSARGAHQKMVWANRALNFSSLCEYTLIAKAGSTNFIDQIIGFADAFNLRHLKASSLHHGTKLKVGFGTVESVDYPLYFL